MLRVTWTLSSECWSIAELVVSALGKVDTGSFLDQVASMSLQEEVEPLSLAIQDYEDSATTVDSCQLFQ